MPRLKARLDLAGVVGFAIASAPAGDACPSTLHTLGSSGELVPVSMSEPATCDGNAEQATAMFDTKKYVLITYAAATGASVVGSTSCTLVVVRKEDGALQCASWDAKVPNRVVGNNDALFLGITGPTSPGIAKLDMSATPPALSVVYDAMSTGRIDGFDANNLDDVLVAGDFGARVLEASGGAVTINGSVTACQWYDTSTDAFYIGSGRLKTSLRPARLVIERLDASYAPVLAGEITAASNPAPGCSFALTNGAQAVGWTNNPTPSLVELASASSGLCWESMGSPVGSCTMDASCNGTCAGGGACLGGVCCVGGSHDGDACMNGDADCVGTCTKAGASHPVAGVTAITAASGHGSTVFVQGTSSGNAVLLGVTTSAFTPVTLLQAGDFTLTATSIAKNGELSWAGQRTSDGAQVVGTCSATSCIPQNAAAPAVTALQRID
jgi:hypothetical protein